MTKVCVHGLFLFPYLSFSLSYTLFPPLPAPHPFPAMRGYIYSPRVFCFDLILFILAEEINVKLTWESENYMFYGEKIIISELLQFTVYPQKKIEKSQISN